MTVYIGDTLVSGVDDVSPGGAAIQTYAGANLATTDSKILATPGAINTKGAWTELVNSLDHDSSWLNLALTASTSANWQDSLVDIGIGDGTPGGTTTVIENLHIQTSNGDYSVAPYSFPFHFDAGTRIWARQQIAVAVLGVIGVGLWAIGSEGTSPTSLVTLGADTSDSGGTSIDPGASANTKPTTFTTVGTPDVDLSGIMIAFPGQNNSVRTNCWWLFDFATGATGSETVRIGNFPVRVATPTDLVLPRGGTYFPYNIPAGTRLSVRSQCSITDAADRLLDVIIYGIPAV